MSLCVLFVFLWSKSHHIRYEQSQACVNLISEHCGAERVVVLKLPFLASTEAEYLHAIEEQLKRLTSAGRRIRFAFIDRCPQSAGTRESGSSGAVYVPHRPSPTEIEWVTSQCAC